MVQEIALFWLVLAGFLFADNLVLIPKGGDFLKLGLAGRPYYQPGGRLMARGRDLVLLNPLNPFDRLVLAQRAIGPLDALQWRRAAQALRARRRGAAWLSAIGALYLVALLPLVAFSWQVHFSTVLLGLVSLHLLLWAAAVVVLVVERERLGVPGSRVLSLAIEAFFVPAYTIDLGKRVGYRQVLDVSAMAVALRELRRTGDDDERGLQGYRLTQRLDELAEELGDEPSGAASALRDWIKDARQCLKTSVPSTGS